MSEPLIRKEIKALEAGKIKAMASKMSASLSEISRSDAGINVLRFLLHESGFLAPLTYVTPEGVNKDVLLANEAKRTMYLGLRAFMDVDTITRVELDGIDEKKKQEAKNG